MKNKFSITTENQPNVLYRLINVFYKRRINISSMNFNENKNTFKITVIAEISNEAAKKIKKQIYKIIEVIEVI